MFPRAILMEFTQLGGKRKITISQWRKQVRIDLREYYEKDGEMLPGRKGM